MPFFLLIVGVVFLISAAKGTQNQLFSLLKGDFSGPDNYFYWLVSILIVGAFGYIPKFKPVSDIFLVLIVLSLVLARGKAGLFQKASAALTLTNTPAPQTSTSSSSLSSAFGNLPSLSMGSNTNSLSDVLGQTSGAGAQSAVNSVIGGDAANAQANTTENENFALGTSSIYSPISNLIQ